jgi:diguanylate cyclase (GGDEF)-like protein
MAAALVGFCFAPSRPQRYPARRFVEGAMPKEDARSRAAKPRTRPKSMRAPQRHSAGPVERIEPPARPARAAAVELAAEVARLEQELATARAQVAALAAFAQIDPLTDILNRRGLERELKRSLAHVKRYGVSAALLYLDLDGFKRINDRYGHAAGDTVLKAVAMVLDRHSRESDVVARVGGDEFVLLLWNCPEADAQVKAQAIEAAIARMTPSHAGVPLQVGASCGVAMLLPLDRPQDLLDRADRAMYARKLARGGLRRAV